MTHWHCASSLFVLFGWETQPKFPCCWFKIRLGVFTEGVSGCSAWQTCVRCLFWFSAFSSKWRSETKTISFFFFFFPKHINREDLALTFIYFFNLFVEQTEEDKKESIKLCISNKLELFLKVSSSYQTCGRPKIVQPCLPLHLPPSTLLGLLTYCIAVFAVMSTG